MSHGMTVRDQAILQHLCQEHWAIQETVMDRLLEIVSRHADDAKLDTADIRAAIGDKPDRKPEDAYRVEGDTAIIGISGVIAKHASMVNGVSQPTGSSVERIKVDLGRALADGRVRNVLLRFESPGGMISGVSDLAEAIYAARQSKRIVAFADDLAASAAYWLASQASELYANGVAAVGSIGVVSVLVDDSERAGESGRRWIVVRAGERKGGGGAPVPVSEIDIQEVQIRVDAVHAVFIEDVARGRGVNIDAITPIADGRVLTGRQAVSAGLVDAITTLDAVMGMLATGAKAITSKTVNGGRRVAAAAAETPTVAASDKESEMPRQTDSPTPPPAAEAKTPETPAKQPDNANAVQDAVTAERKRVGEITRALAGATFAEIREKAIEAGSTVEQARAAGFDAANTRIGELEAECRTLRGLMAKAGMAADKLPPADAGDRETPEAAGAAGKNPQAAAYEAAVGELVKAGKTASQAHSLAAKADPDGHAAWVESTQPAKR